MPQRKGRGMPLWLEIVLVLVLKAALLAGARTLWFSDPLTRTRQMTVPQARIGQQLLGTREAGAPVHPPPPGPAPR
ncbi:hypothetical protein N8I74_08240 [Chitiniphilus purpureus]|uniref:Uncharacterized protein n=1 Tax=Chitiniphilus purpureus TaxID=2981137 RepID=A0ABY6DRI8_9NEIS|nr:hypothetical protein [Chitiniphilus sp. CD1]UXY16985.1 hypothetical protein N8I74_08240 [Chitiniphilus sp. CD1]